MTVRGKTPAEARRDVEFGFVFQSPVLFPWLRVLGNVMLPDRILGKRNPLAVRDPQAHARGLLRDVGLEGFEEYYPEHISGGCSSGWRSPGPQLRPVNTADGRAVGALDEFTRDNLNIQLLEVWQQTGPTVLFVTHSLSEAIILSDRVVVLSPRPGSVIRIADVPFERPRQLAVRYRPDFAALNGELRELLQVDSRAAGDGEGERP